MKPTQVTDLLATIKNTFISFFSILMFVALGVGVFLGISWASPALENATEGMFNEGNFHHYQIQYPYGLTDTDIATLRNIKGVSKIEAERQSFQTLRIGEDKYTVKVQSLGQDIDTPLIVKGKLPTSANEIALHEESARNIGLKVGDTITFDKDADEEDSTAKDGKSTKSSKDGEKDDSGKDADANEKANADDKADKSKEASKDDKAENDSGMKYLKSGSFKVTAIINSADYVAYTPGTYGFSSSPSGTVDLLAWVTDDAFDASAYQDGYPIVNVRCSALDDMNTFDKEYKETSDKIIKPLEKLGSQLATARYDNLHDQAQKKIDDGQAKIDKAEKEIAQGEKDIAQGEKDLEEGRAELERRRAEAQAELDNAYAQLMDGEAKKADAERQLANARARVNDGQAKIDEADRAIAEARAEVNDAESYKKKCDEELAAGKITEEEYNKRLDERGAQADKKLQPIAKRYGRSIPNIRHDNYSDALAIAHVALANTEEIPVTVDGKEMTLGEARQRLASAKTDLANAEAEYNAAVVELNNGWAQYNDGKATFEAEVAKAEQEIADGEAQIEEAKKKVADGKKQVEENKPILEEAKKKLAELVKYNWTIMPRAYNAGKAEVSTFCDVTDNLSISMALLFIIVGLLVSYFAVSRIVREQVTQIGTKKALGFRQKEITSSFLWYSGLAVVIGAIVGALLAYFVVEAIIDSVFGGMFAFGMYPAYFGWGLFLIIFAIELGLMLITTYLACRKILKEHAVELLRGDKLPSLKPHFYEKWGIWDKLPLLVQTIVNNCVNDVRRALSTIVGVAGCTALIVTALTLNDDVMKSYDTHYQNVYGFNTIAYADPNVKNAAGNLAKALEDKGYKTAQAFAKSYLLVQPDGESGAIRIIVPMDAKSFKKLYHVNPVTDGKFDISKEGAWVSQAYAEHLNAQVGDKIVVDGSDGTKHKITILGFYEFWLSYNEMIMNKDYYEKVFGTTSPNVVLCQTGDTSIEKVKKSIVDIEGYDSVVDDAAVQFSSFDTFSAVSNAVVIIYLVLAVLMAIVVLLNLNVMFINEKKRELIVLMINGYRVKDARHYISYDSIVLTALGITVGVFLGNLMGSITVVSIEPVTGVFIKDPDALAILVGVVGTILLAIIMGLIALRRINKFDLTDINRF